jgi:N-acyl-D-amino-acid deacylase
MTSFTAQTHDLMDRGVLRPGLVADITVFDPEKIEDTATFENPIQYPQGIEYVVVNGEVTVERGKHTGSRAGKVLRKNYRLIGSGTSAKLIHHDVAE